MGNRIRMVGIDLDGTLLTGKKNLLPYTEEVLRRTIEKGIEVVIATGRPSFGIPEELKKMPGIRYAVAVNGAKVLELKTDRILQEDLLSREKAREMLKIFREYQTVPEVYTRGRGYVNRDELERLLEYYDNPDIVPYLLQTRGLADDICELLEECGNGVEKVQAIFKDEKEWLEARARIEAIPGVKPVSSLGRNIEVGRADVNKAKGLKWLGEHLKIREEEMMTLGDGDNDLEMIRMAGIGVAMGNAVGVLKEAADYVTLDNEEEGAAKAIERFALS